MALTAVQTAMNLEDKTVHPFFSRPPSMPVSVIGLVICLHVTASNGSDQEPHTNNPTVDNTHDPDLSNTSSQSEQEQKKRARKPTIVRHTKTASSDLKSQALLHAFTHSSNPHGKDTGVGLTENGELLSVPSLEEDPNHDRRKRQKTASPVPQSIQICVPEPSRCIDEQIDMNRLTVKSKAIELDPTITGDTTANQAGKAIPTHSILEHTQEPSVSANLDMQRPDVVVTNSDPAAEEAKKTTPKKHIKITKTGKLLSSPPQSVVNPSTPPKKRRGRPSKAKILPTVTVICYGAGLDTASRIALGQKIDDILNNPKRSTRRPTTPKKAPTKPKGPPKATHPFFAGKPNPKDPVNLKPSSDQRSATPRKSTVTPGKLRAEAIRDRLPESIPTFGSSNGPNKPNKQSGLYEPMWPTRETAHVRSLDVNGGSAQFVHPACTTFPLKPKKLKHNVSSLTEEENVIARLSRSLQFALDEDGEIPTCDFAPPKGVRLPKRLLTNGIDIRERVSHQILSKGRSKQHELMEEQHAAVTALLNKIDHTLTPFDEGRCELQAWNQKYSPQCVSDVLQTGLEATMLKSWLHSLTVLAVGGAPKASVPLDAKRPPKKKRKKAVDDFIVSEDDVEEEEDMVDLAVGNGAGPYKLPSVVRRRWTRDKNVILVSGPHGCGKSAMIQAVAKEMSFEVFEIHSGMRRSGKDIQDKVGDMTANHLVNHKRGTLAIKEDTSTAENTDNESIAKALEDDITSGRQGTMTSFFKVKPVSKPKPQLPPKIVEEPLSEEAKSSSVSTQAILPVLTAARNSQKQSLILFEEADVLFEEDQQFWIQVLKIAFSSKRPIIITCNDELRVPSLDLPLAAILRLEPPAVDLATDYLLALAGNEGHILERKALSDLYKAKRHDLRASIAELNFWCQMSVGDRKGGLEWIYQRWPRGQDVDMEGRLLRVASEGTYQPGMGWMSHNVFQSQTNPVFDRQEEIMRQAWTDWGISPLDMTNPRPEASLSDSPSRNVLEELKRLDDFADSLSSADMYCRVGLPTYSCDHDQPMDPTLPAMTDKARLSYTLAAPVIQIDHCSDYLNMDSALYLNTALLARRAFPDVATYMSSTAFSTASTEGEYADNIVDYLEGQRGKSDRLTRMDFAAALDILAAPPDYMQSERAFYNLTPSSFDRTFNLITLDLAPYVRTIVAHEQVLDTQRFCVSSLLSAGGTGKRSRTTRASRVAQEGGARETKRRERWFDSDLDFDLVMRTAGKQWAGLGWRGEGEDGTNSMTGTLDGAQDTDVSMQDSQEVHTYIHTQQHDEGR